MSESVELHPAYQWDCPSCGRENFERIAILGKNDSWEVPSGVKCNHCKSLFPSYDQFDDQFDDFDSEPDVGPMETDI